MTKKRRALYITLYAFGITVSVSLIYVFHYYADVQHILWVLGGHSKAALISMLANFLIGGCIGFIVVNFARKDDITQHFPRLKRKHPRIILYILGVTAPLYFLYSWANAWVSFYFPSRSLLSLLSDIHGGIPLGLAGMFTVGCIGFAIVSLLLRDYAEQSTPFLKRKPLLIGFYILGTIGSLSLVCLPFPLLVPGFDVGMSYTDMLWFLPMLVVGGCIGLATMSIVLRDDLTEHFTFLRRKAFRAAFYTISIASGFWVSLWLAVIAAFLSGPYGFSLPLGVTTIGGCMGFAAAGIILRGNLKRTLSITGIIVGVCMVITMLAVGIMSSSITGIIVGVCMVIIMLEVGIMSLLYP
jgi:hypothetical protein